MNGLLDILLWVLALWAGSGLIGGVAIAVYLVAFRTAENDADAPPSPIEPRARTERGAGLSRDLATTVASGAGEEMRR
jgi:hypothetical protein